MTVKFTTNPVSAPYTTVVFFANTTWTIPSDWSNTNIFHAIGGGGGAGGGTGSGSGQGGGGGAYASSNNITGLSVGGSITIVVGPGGVNAAAWSGNPGSNGGNSWVNWQGTSAPTTTANGILAAGANGGGPYANSLALGANGGQATASIGNVKFSGGVGGNNYLGFGDGGSGGGGAAGPHGAGAAGGDPQDVNSNNFGYCGAGGGAADGGTRGPYGFGGQATGGNGGIAFDGTAGGQGGNSSVKVGGNGSNGSGGGGGFGDGTATVGANGGFGGMEVLWTDSSNGAQAGPGGGGGGCGGSESTTGTPDVAGGSLGYGGGGGASGYTPAATPAGIPAPGSKGVVVIQYVSSTPVAQGTNNQIQFIAQSNNTTNQIVFGPDPLNANMVAWWMLNEGTGTTAADYTGLANTATFTSAPTWITPTGHSGNAVTTDGTIWANTGNPSNLRLTTAGTLSAWIKTSNTTALDIYVCGKINTSTDANGYTFYLNTGKIGFEVANSTAATGAVYGTAISDNAWHHVVGKWDATGVYIYVDGVLRTSNTTAPIVCDSTGSNFGIGWGGQGTGLKYTGSIDEVRVWNRALSNNDIARLFLQ